MKTESTLEVHAEIAAEFLAGSNRRLHKDSVCIFASVSGTTQEVLDAANYCKEKGAVTIGFLAKADTPLGEAVDYCIATGHEQHSFDTFFHGTLELVEEDTSIILCHGEDETRPLTDRAENFVKKISKEVFLLDTKDYALEGISPEFRKYVAINVNWTLLNRISAYLERERNHPLSVRRYYRVMEY